MKRWLLWSSLALNLAVVAAYAHQRRALPPPEAALVARLQLNPAQTESLSTLQRNLRGRALALREQSAPIQRALLAEMRRDAPDGARLRALLQDYGAARSALQGEIVLALVAYRAALAPSQRAAFDSALSEPAFLRRMSGFGVPATPP
ncbi:MAG: periplasmic heavy metal sensor [Xanthomonadales bacterium]|nr:hypothetical protein [Xanthomonadales bacterium]MCC6593652.1 periplasmic heavy metal sensor [Xanthomonadales bacterium]